MNPLQRKLNIRIDETKKLVVEILELSEEVPDRHAFENYLRGLKPETLRERHALMKRQSAPTKSERGWRVRAFSQTVA